MSEKLIGAIDIGTTKIVAVVGEITNDGDSFRVLEYHVTPSQGIKGGIVEDFQKVVQSIKKAVDKVGMVEKYGIEEVYVGVAGHTVRSTENTSYRMIRDKEITKEHIDELKQEMYNTVVDDSEVVLHVIERAYILDDMHEVINPIGNEAKKLEGKFHLIIANKSFINSVSRCVNNAGLRVKRFIFEPLASAASVLTKEEEEGGIALVDIGGGTTDIVIIKEGIVLHSAVIPLGGNSITDDIKNALRILGGTAEDIKIKYGKAIAGKALENENIHIPGIAGREPIEISVRDLALIVQARVLEIIDSVHEEIKPYKDQIAVGITLTGGGALLDQIDLFFRYRTGLGVRLAKPDIDDIPELAKPQFSTTIGLLKKGMMYEKQVASNTQKRTKPKTGQSQKKQTEKGGIFDALLEKLSNFFLGPDDEL